MPDPRSRARAAVDALELLAGVAAVLWSLAQIHPALAVGVAGVCAIARNLHRTSRRGA